MSIAPLSDRASDPDDRPAARFQTRDRIDLLGVGFDAVDESAVVEGVLDALGQGEGGWISTPNSHHLRACQYSEEYRALIDDASYVVADGMPLVWASRIQGTPLPGRVPGSDLVWSLARAAARGQRSIFLLGGDEGVAPRAQAMLEQTIPGLRVAGTYFPPMGFEHDQDEQERIMQALAEARPDIVYVGLGFPKQERLIRSLREAMTDTWFLGIGISLSFISDDVVRAPRWMQASGLEWLHRLWQEPRRLFRRYVCEGIPFAARLETVALLRRLRWTLERSRRSQTSAGLLPWR